MTADMHHIVIDIETLAVTPDASILAIGAAVLDPQLWLMTSRYLANVDPGQSSDAYAINPDTVLWWLRQSEQARREAASGETYIGTALDGLCEWMAIFAPFKVWANPPRVDIAILEHAYRVEGRLAPWDHRDVLDMRTIRHLVDPDGHLMPEDKGKHTALGDAVWQAGYLSRMLAEMRS